jgi:hypothetical protein
MNERSLNPVKIATNVHAGAEPASVTSLRRPGLGALANPGRRGDFSFSERRRFFAPLCPGVEDILS